MSKEIKSFFNEIENTQDFFLLWRLYNDPKKVIGYDLDKEELFNMYDYCRLMMNNNLIRFIKLALKDDLFSIRANIDIWIKFGAIIYDSIDFKKYYHMVDSDLLQLFKNEITVNEYFERLGDRKPPMPIISGYEIYQKHSKLYDLKYPKKQIEEYNEKEAKKVRDLVNLRIQVLLEEKTKEDDRKAALKWIEEDDYTDESNFDNAYLCRHQLFSDFAEPFSIIPGLSRTVLNDLVCDNRFLDIIEYKIDEDKIAFLPLENALDIIIMEINIKKGEIRFLEYFVNQLGINRIREFDLRKAEKLVSKITLYKINNNKQGNILQLYTK